MRLQTSPYHIFFQFEAQRNSEVGYIVISFLTYTLFGLEKESGNGKKIIESMIPILVKYLSYLNPFHWEKAVI